MRAMNSRLLDGPTRNTFVVDSILVLPAPNPTIERSARLPWLILVNSPSTIHESVTGFWLPTVRTLAGAMYFVRRWARRSAICFDTPFSKVRRLSPSRSTRRELGANVKGVMKICGGVISFEGAGGNWDPVTLTDAQPVKRTVKARPRTMCDGIECIR